MPKRLTFALLAAAVALGVLVTSALALYPQLRAKLTGLAIGGVTETQVGRQTTITGSTADGAVRLSNPDPMNA